MADHILGYTGAELDALLTKVDQMPAGGSSLKFEIVDELPAESVDTSTIYLVATGAGDYNEYIYVNNSWELLGTTAIDLTDYATKEYVDNADHYVWVPFQAEYTAEDYATYYPMLTKAYNNNQPIFMRFEKGENKDIQIILTIYEKNIENNTEKFHFEYSENGALAEVDLIFDTVAQTLSMESNTVAAVIKTITEDLYFVDGTDPKTILPNGCYKLTGKVYFNGVENADYTSFDVDYVSVVVYSDVYFIYANSANQLRRNNYGCLYRRYTYETGIWTPDSPTNSWVVNMATQNYVNERSFVKVISEKIAFASGVDPSETFGSGWYMFKKGVSFDGVDNDWFDAYTLVEIRSYSNYFYMYLFDPDSTWRSGGRIGIYCYYKHADQKWYPGGDSCYTSTALTTSTGLSKTNTDEYTPTADYHPATKKYVDDNTMPASDVINAFWKGTQAEYDAIAEKNPTTLYIIEE